MDILLAEPDPAQRKRVREALQRGGHHLFEVDNGEQTLEALSGHAFDMVLIDLHLPGIGGIEAVRLFHFSRTPEDWPVFVVLAAHPSAEEVRECRRLDIAAIVHKPIQPRTLVQTIATTARDRRSQPSELYGKRVEHISESALPIMDEHNLRDLERLGESPDFLSQLINEFLAQIDASLSRTREARATDEGYARFLELGHTLKDIAGNLGALRLYELGLTASQLPEAIFEREGEQLLSRIEQAFAQTRAILLQHLERQGLRNDPTG
jgi:two-component system sensor histidine kinase RpfC